MYNFPDSGVLESESGSKRSARYNARHKHVSMTALPLLPLKSPKRQSFQLLTYAAIQDSRYHTCRTANCNLWCGCRHQAQLFSGWTRAKSCLALLSTDQCSKVKWTTFTAKIWLSSSVFSSDLTLSSTLLCVDCLFVLISSDLRYCSDDSKAVGRSAHLLLISSLYACFHGSAIFSVALQGCRCDVTRPHLWMFY